VRILLVGDYPPDATLGSTKVLLKLQEEYRTLGHTCDVVLGDRIGAFPRSRHLRQALAPLAAWTAVRRAVRGAGPYDVIDVSSAEGLWIAMVRRPLGRPAVVSRSHGLEHLNYRRMLDDHAAGIRRKPWTRRILYPLLRLTEVAAAARAADRLLLLNDQDCLFARQRRWKADALIHVVPHGVSERFLADAPAPGAPRGRGLLFCGTWTEMKGVGYLAEAFSRLTASGVDARLTVLGGGVPDERIRMAFPEAARSRVSIAPRAAEDEVMAAFRSHDVLVSPSVYEGFGMVVVEAMSQRLPIVATPVGCARTLVEPERTGLLVPPRDPVALARALERMVRDPDLRARCAASGF
jgi:glycosyltransferase involved in cell wall biosynthesis